MNPKTQYVAGLYTAENRRFKLFLRKNKPGHWQHEKHNLLGGHIESGENAFEAMVREFKEEAGIKTKISDWGQKLLLTGPTWAVHFFHMDGVIDQNIFTNHAEGTNEWHENIPQTAIPNLHWIVPMMLDMTIIFPIHIMDSK